MAKPLDDYKQKRDFGRTTEPAGAVPRGGFRGAAPVFVVHRHEARRLHYDLRLEWDGVLCSWAVPKGFSYDPKEKHLAVRTEDHPIEYEHFSGVIPKGEYGAGTMTIWDRGTYEFVSADPSAELAKGEVKLILHGRRLRGEWHLVLLKDGEQRNWLMFKSKDRYAGGGSAGVSFDLTEAEPAAFPKAWRRMAVGGERAPFSDTDWAFEMEFAGRRALAWKQGERAGLRGVKPRCPDLDEPLLNLRGTEALIDGVLVALDEHERPSRELLDRRLSGAGDSPVCFYAFDLLHYEGFDLRKLPLLQRKAALRAILPARPELLFVDHVLGNGEPLVDAVAAAGLPGVVAKRAAGAYRAGASEDWLRIPVARDGTAASGSVSAALAGSETASTSPARFRYTNLDKVYWPEEGFTKGDLVAYYEAVADVLLPHLAERPIHMNRFPDGIDGKSFYQRQLKEGMPDWIETIAIESGSKEAPVTQMLCNDRDTLLYLANQGSIDLHPWLSRRGSLDSPDFAVIDLDPKTAPFRDVVRIAREVGKVLRGVGLRPLLKTSGKTGLHVFVPLQAGYDYDQSRMFCEAVARIVTRELSDIATIERNPGERGGKVYIDFLQNRRSQTIVPPYSARPIRGAQVSAPLEWDELDADLSPALHTIRNMPQRLEQRGDLFRAALTDGQDLLPAIEALGKYLT